MLRFRCLTLPFWLSSRSRGPGERTFSREWEEPASQQSRIASGMGWIAPVHRKERDE